MLLGTCTISTRAKANSNQMLGGNLVVLARKDRKSADVSVAPVWLK